MQVAALSLASGVQAGPFHAAQVQSSNVAAELVEKAATARYPCVHIYCEKVSNQLREKFRRFSGTARMVAEVRVSLSRLEQVEGVSQVVANAVTEVLDESRGDWGQGMFYSGAYEVTFGPVKAGGKNFIQITKVAFDVDVSAD